MLGNRHRIKYHKIKIYLMMPWFDSSMVIIISFDICLT